MIVEIFKGFVLLKDDVFTKLSECNMLLCVVLKQKLLEVFVRVFDFEVPFFPEKVCSIGEFPFRNPLIVVDFDFVKVLPEFIVETQVDEEILEDSFGDIVLAVGTGFFDFL